MLLVEVFLPSPTIFVLIKLIIVIVICILILIIIEIKLEIKIKIISEIKIKIKMIKSIICSSINIFGWSMVHLLFRKIFVIFFKHFVWFENI